MNVWLNLTLIREAGELLQHEEEGVEAVASLLDELACMQQRRGLLGCVGSCTVWGFTPQQKAEKMEQVTSAACAASTTRWTAPDRGGLQNGGAPMHSTPHAQPAAGKIACKTWQNDWLCGPELSR